MRIFREKPCQRRHHRLTAPLYVKFAQQSTIKASDWSLGGLRLDNLDLPLPAPQSTLALTISLPFQGYDISFVCQVTVLRTIHETHTILVEFKDLEQRSCDLMSHFVDDLIRGKMGTIDDTICRIDVPVTPISTEPTPNPNEQLPVRRLPLKSILMASFYILLGLAVFSYLSIVIYSNTFVLEISSSVVSSKIHIIKMPVSGAIKPINYLLGANIQAGEVLFRIDNQALTNKINEQHFKIKAVENKLWQATEKYRIEGERLKLYQLVSETDKKVTEARLASKHEQLKFADKNYIRIQRLYKNQAVSEKALDDAKQQQIKAEFSVQALNAQLAQVSAMQAVSDRRHYNHKEFTTDLDLNAVALQGIYSELSIVKAKLSQLQQAQQAQLVRAPYNGKIVGLLQPAYSIASHNEPILLLQEDGQIKVTAYLNQQEVLHIGLGDSASVFLPALNQQLPAIVQKIDRNSYYLNQKQGRYNWFDKQERSAMVTLTIQLTPENQLFIEAGLPAVVIFKRRSTSSILSSLLNKKNEVMHVEI